MENQTKKRSELIKNIYCMLSYVFEVLNKRSFSEVGKENFDSALELLTALFIQGVKNLLKLGMKNSYKLKSGTLPSIRGKINLSESIKEQSLYLNQLNCNFDEFSPNNLENQIIKTILVKLLKSEISLKEKKELKKLLVLFSDIDLIDLKSVNWKPFRSERNQILRFVLFISYLIYQGMIQSEENPKLKGMDYLSEPLLSWLYEKFLLSYFRKEFPDLHVSASRIPWQLDNEESFLLPVMQSDIMITGGNNVLIIDAKYYSKTLQTFHDKSSIHSGNLYQIFTYVKNKQEEDKKKQVSGMLLYARTLDELQPDQEYQMSGNKISVKTLDLNQPFDLIKKDLNQIIQDNFNSHLG